MAKGKTLNPADAFRKAQRKKELKKADLEEEIEQLEAKGDDADKARLTQLKTDLEKIMAKKEEYVAEHPEHRRLVYKARKRDGEDDNIEEKPPPAKRNVFNKHGLPRHPERSIYYDPVMNPYGVPPPGMPYAERPLRPDEIDSDAENQDDDDDIAMPEGPPPGSSAIPVDSDDDIPMPDGPPPGQEPDEETEDIPSNPPLPPGLPPLPVGLPPPPPSMMPPHVNNSAFPPPPPGPPPPNQFMPSTMPVPPLGFPPMTGMPNFPPFGFSMPPPPPGFFPGRSLSASAMQDPLSSIPHQTYQAHKSNHNQPTPSSHPSLPAKPVSAINAQVTAAATVSAAPQLRDFKKEATAFVPAALKRKKAGASGGGLSAKINAAPSLGAGETGEATPSQARPDLLSTLKDQFGPAPIPAAVSNPSAGKANASEKKPDDYDKFMEEMGDIIGPK